MNGNLISKWLFRHDYIRHALDKQRSYKPEEVYVRQGDFDSLTSYNKEYTRKTNKPLFMVFIQGYFGLI